MKAQEGAFADSIFFFFVCDSIDLFERGFGLLETAEVGGKTESQVRGLPFKRECLVCLSSGQLWS